MRMTRALTGNRIYRSPGPILERIHMHPYLGERILGRVPGLKGEAALAFKQRILAAADS